MQVVQVLPALLGCIYRVHWCRCAGSLWLQDLPAVWLWSSGRVSPPFVLFLALLLVRCLQIWLYFAFLGRFRGFWAFRVGLCCLGALRGLWGFCVRERLGGLKA